MKIDESKNEISLYLLIISDIYAQAITSGFRTQNTAPQASYQVHKEEHASIQVASFTKELFTVTVGQDSLEGGGVIQAQTKNGK